MQPSFEWNVDVSLPVSGQTPEARHASASGAQIAAKARAELTVRYVTLLIAVGPLSDNEAARLLSVPLSSINSTRNGVAGQSEPKRVQPSGQFEETSFGTKRCRWAWRG